MNELIVSSSPFMHSKNDVNKMFLFVSLALVFPAIYGIILFGLNAFLIILISVAVCGASEIIYNLFTKKKFDIDNISFLVTALLLALSLPATTPLYVVVICAFFSVFVVKMAFGGLGRNYFNPALSGRCLAGIIVPGLSAKLYELTVVGEDYVSLTAGGSNELSSLILGQGTGGIGTTFILMLFAIFVVLAFLKIIDAKIPVFAIAGYFVVSICMMGLDATMTNMFSGSFLFVAIFMLSDPNTSPNTLLGQFVYAFGYGALTALLWKFGFLGENTAFAVALFVNLLVPFMDKYFVLRPISVGGFRYARKN